MCAARIGQLLNLSSLGNDCGISHNTASAWISILQASYVITLLEPHHENFNKRVVKAPKLYFYDPGLAAWLLGIQNPEQLAIHSHRGALFESMVIGEVIKTGYNRGRDARIAFWRDRSGNELDLVLDGGKRLVPVEIKSSKTINTDYFQILSKWSKWAGKRAGTPHLIYGGDQEQNRSAVQVLPWFKTKKIVPAAG